ncbi:CCA tRNA nucleotidyltransferase [Roseomonas sp. HF4]|uniref:CCA tRNA nucleotidyltransferase n=1 Tax=Roseomonas sp. HF4 TaxID=2562313 RepID=UPI001F106066|nr:CCA tRNA nucleotidyltransferase [Roseomonas sp. HF4]
MSPAPAGAIPRPGFLDIPAVAAVLAALPGARAVGGCVRDALAGLPSADVDVAAPLPPEEIAKRLGAAGLKVFETGLAHGTVTAVLEHVPVEVTALRRDVLTDGRHAVVEWTVDWREDAARRDFTINAMSLAPDGALFDYFGGRADLAAGLVRFVGDPDTRLAEDYLRALRFFRFQARYGRGAPDAAAVAAIRRAVPGLARLSVERVWMEVKRILAVPDPVPAVALMAETGVLGAVLHEPWDLDALRRLQMLDVSADPLFRLVALVPGEGKADAVAQRLKASWNERMYLHHYMQNSTRRPYGGAMALVPPFDTAENAARWSLFIAYSEVRKEAGARDFADRILLMRDFAERGARHRYWTEARRHAAILPVPHFPLSGVDAVAEGVQPGPLMGELLGRTRLWWRERGCTPTQDECLEEFRRLRAERLGGGGGGGGGGAALGG